MKKLISALFLGLVFVSVSAQKVDLDKIRFEYKYRTIPQELVDKSFQTYSVDVKKTVALEHFSHNDATNNINIEGRKKVDGGGHIQVVVSFGDLIFEKSEVKENVIIDRNKDGIETGRRFEYWVVVAYSFGSDFYVNDYTGKSIKFFNTVKTGRSIKEYSTYNNRKFTQYGDASNYLRDNKLEIKTMLIAQEINQTIKEVNSCLRRSFAYASGAEWVSIMKMDSKKHPENTDFTTHATTVSEKLKTITADEIPAGTKEALEAASNYFKTIPEKYTDPEDKQAKKLRYGAYYNLMMISYMLEDYDVAIAFANKIIANLYDEKDGEKMIKDINELKAEMAKHQIPTNHYMPNLSNANPPQ